MNNPKFLLFFLFWFALALDCVMIVLDFDEYRIFTKTLLAPLLLIAINMESRNTKHKRSKVIVNLAFIFCFVGDILLLQEMESFSFVYGLGAFFLAQLFFIMFFMRLKAFTARHRIFLFFAGIIIFVYLLILLLLLWENIERQHLELPVALYSLALGFMLLSAINTIKNKGLKRVAPVYFIPGAFLFVLSDSILAFAKFSPGFSSDGKDYVPISIMITYAGALFMFATGIIRFLRK